MKLTPFVALALAVAAANGATPLPNPPPPAKEKAAAKPKPAKPPPQVLVVSDVFGDVPETLRPSPGRPIYYVIMGKTERDLGAPIAGEPRADPAVVEKEVIKILATQGFVQTIVGGPMPSIALVLTWGSANLDSMDYTTPPPPPSGPPDPSAPQPTDVTNTFHFNGREIAMLVGADKANQNLVDQNRLSEINQAAAESRVYIFVGAFDLQELMKKKKKLLWRTRMSIESTHYSLPESISVMLASAAPYFAREAPLPVMVDEAARRKAEVLIGTPYVVPDTPKAEAKADSKSKAK